MGPLGAVPPGVVPPGAVPPGAMPPGAFVPPHAGMFAAPPPPPPLGVGINRRQAPPPARPAEPPSPRTVTRALAKGKEVREYVDLDDKDSLAKEAAKASSEEKTKGQKKTAAAKV